MRILLSLAACVALASPAAADCFGHTEPNFGGEKIQLASGQCFIMAKSGVATDFCKGMPTNRIPAWNNLLSSVRATNGSSYLFYTKLVQPSPGGSGDGDRRVLEAGFNNNISILICK